MLFQVADCVSSAKTRIQQLEESKLSLKHKVTELEHANFVLHQQIKDLKEHLRTAIEQKTTMERFISCNSVNCSPWSGR